MAVRASRTSSSLNGLMIAITIFMGPIPAWARFRPTGRSRLRFHHAEMFTTRAQPGPLESNAVPDRDRSLTDYESGPFRPLRELHVPAPIRRAQSVVRLAQIVGRPGRRHNPAQRQSKKTVMGWGDLLQRFAVLGDIEAFQLLLHRHPQRREYAHQLEQHKGDAAAPHQRGGDPVELDQDLLRIALDQACGAADRVHRKNAGEQCAGQSANAVDAEHVERVVIFEALLEPGAGPAAERY